MLLQKMAEVQDGLRTACNPPPNNFSTCCRSGGFSSISSRLPLLILQLDSLERLPTSTYIDYLYMLSQH